MTSDRVALRSLGVTLTLGALTLGACDDGHAAKETSPESVERAPAKAPASADGAGADAKAPDGEAAARGIQAGDVIVSVNSKQIKAVCDVDEAVKAATGAGRKAVLFQVQRDAANRFVALPVDQG